MNRRRAIGLLAAMATWRWARSAETKTYSIGLLWLEVEKPSRFIPSLLAGLRERGYVPGRNLNVIDRYIVASYEALPQAAAQLVAQNPDIIVSYGSTATQAAAKATSTIPIAFASGGDAPALGLAKSLAHPGGNVTGLSLMNIEVVAKRVQLLKSAFPRMRRLAFIYYVQSEGERIQLAEAARAAEKVGVGMKEIPLNRAEEIPAAIASLAKQRVDGIVFAGSSVFRANRVGLVAAVAEAKLPAIYSDAAYTDLGGLMSYGQDISRSFYRVAGYVDRLLRGESAAEMPIEQFSNAELIINLRAAAKQSWTIPAPVLLQASRTIN